MVSSGTCAGLLLDWRHVVQTTSVLRAEVALAWLTEGFREREDSVHRPVSNDRRAAANVSRVLRLDSC